MAIGHRQKQKPPRSSTAKHKTRLVWVGAVSVLLAAATLWFVFSPMPAAWLIRLLFQNSATVPPENYNEIQARVLTSKDVDYPSAYGRNTADIYTPKGEEGPYPVVLWVHGGAFVGGDKRDVQVFATMLAAEGFGVVCINYLRAPEGNYPVPVIQTAEAYRWLSHIAGDYRLDTSRVVVAGDSAGAHVAAQFAAAQTNSDFAAQLPAEIQTHTDGPKAVLLFCGPFDAAQLANGGNAPMDFLIHRAAWAYFGTPDWVERFSGQITLLKHITEAFPPSFISDGNTLSFEEQGRALADALLQMGVPVETFFIPVQEGKAMHEYQFAMNNAFALEAFRKTVDFLQSCIKY